MTYHRHHYNCEIGCKIRVVYIREDKKWQRIGEFYTKCCQFKLDKLIKIETMTPTIVSQKTNSSDKSIPKMFVFYLTQEMENMFLSNKYKWQYEMITDSSQTTTVKTNDQNVIDYLLSSLNFTAKSDTVTSSTEVILKRGQIQDPFEISDRELSELCDCLGI